MKDFLTFCVGIPIHNSSQYLEKCINSVLSQNYPDVFVICLDDGSTDDSFHILEEKFGDNKQVLILKNDVNKGISFSRQKILQHARGDYFLWLDSDDYFPTQSLFLLSKAMKRYGEIKDCIFIQNALILNGLKRKLVYPSSSKKYSGDKAKKLSFLDNGIRSYSCVLVIPISCLKGVQFPDSGTKYIDDLYICSQYFAHCSRAIKIPVCGYSYVMRKGTDSHTLDFYLRFSNTLDYLIKKASLECPYVVPALQNRKAVFDSIKIIGEHSHDPEEKIISLLYNQRAQCRKNKMSIKLMKMAGYRLVVQSLSLMLFPRVFIRHYKTVWEKRIL